MIFASFGSFFGGLVAVGTAAPPSACTLAACSSDCAVRDLGFLPKMSSSGGGSGGFEGPDCCGSATRAGGSANSDAGRRALLLFCCCPCGIAMGTMRPALRRRRSSLSSRPSSFCGRFSPRRPGVRPETGAGGRATPRNARFGHVCLDGPATEATDVDRLSARERAAKPDKIVLPSS